MESIARFETGSGNRRKKRSRSGRYEGIETVRVNLHPSSARIGSRGQLMAMADLERHVPPCRALDGKIELLVDGIHLSPEPKGVGIYVQRVVEQLAEHDGDFRVTILKRSSEDVRGLLPECVNVLSVPWRNHLWHGLYVVPRFARKLRADVVLVPYEAPIGPLRAPYAVICHGIPPLLHEAQKEAGGGGALIGAVARYVDDALLPGTLRRAAAVFANSDWVARELASRYTIHLSRIGIAPCAPAHDFEALSKKVDVEQVRIELDSPEGYVLAIYTGDPHENFAVVPAVFDRVVAESLPHNLVVVGVRENEERRVENWIQSRSWKDRARILPFVPVDEHEKLAKLYAAATVYLDPSLMEGFGMQVVEAMASGTAVVCSHRGALAEVTGDAALLVDPTDIEGMATAVITLLADEASARKLGRAACARSRHFSWRLSAMQIRDGLLDAVHAESRTGVVAGIV